MSERPTQSDTTNQVGSWQSLLAFYRFVRKQWLLVFAVAAATTLAVTFYTLGQKKIYLASATVQIEPQAARPLGRDVEDVVDMGAGTFWSNKEYYETQFKIIQSMRVASATVRQLDLQRDPGFLGDAPPGVVLPPQEVPVEAAAERVRAKVKVAPIKDSRLATVTFEDADPARAQKILTTLLDVFIQQNLDDVLDSTSSAVEWLNGQLATLKKELESKEIALHDYKKEKNILSVSFDDQSNMLRAEMNELNSALTGARVKREELGARRAELMKINAEDPVNLPASELLASSLLNTLRNEYVAAVRRRDSLLARGKGSNHPEVAGEQAEVDATKTALVAEIRNIQGSVERDFATVNHQINGLSGLFGSAKHTAMDLNLLEIEYNRLHRSKENTQKLYGLVLERAKESNLTKALRFNNIRMVDKPLLPKSPVKPVVPVNLAFGIIAGLALGLGAAFGREMLDRSIKTPDDVERELNLIFLGLLPQLDAGAGRSAYYGRRRRRGHGQAEDDASRVGPPELAGHNYPTSGIAEAARAIRTNILFMSPDHPYRVLLVTSAGPAEGKTTVACCIAVAMAQAGQRVLLIDCDMRRPRLHKVFSKLNQNGVTTALLDISGLDDLARLKIHALETEVSNLSLLPMGPHAPNPAELLHSESFARLLQELRRRYDRVILDSPPVVPVTDATILSKQVDGTVIVVRAFKTSKELARQAVRAIRDVGGRIVGTVLNAVDLGRQEYGYYHYYYYKRDGYASDAPASREQSAPPPS